MRGVRRWRGVSSGGRWLPRVDGRGVSVVYRWCGGRRLRWPVVNGRSVSIGGRWLHVNRMPRSLRASAYRPSNAHALATVGCNSKYCVMDDIARFRVLIRERRRAASLTALILGQAVSLNRADRRREAAASVLASCYFSSSVTIATAIWLGVVVICCAGLLTSSMPARV